MQINRAAPQQAAPMTRKDLEVIAPQIEYHGSRPETLAIFDLRIPGVAERLHRERAAWQGASELEALGPDHLILIIRAGSLAHGE